MGQNIGAGKEHLIKHYFKLCMQMALAAALFQNFFLFVLEDNIISMFTNSETIAKHIQSAWIVFNIFVVFDTTQGIA